MPIRRLFTGVFIVGAALLSQATCALPIVHESTETFYSSGGTLVEGCRGPGCPAASFTIGDVSGTPLWRIEEQTPYQLVGESLYSLRFRYRVFVLDPDLPLFGFSIANNGFAAELYNQMNPNWTNQHDEAQWIWSSAFGNPILPGTPALDRSFVAATAPLARIGVGFGPVEFLLRIDDEFVVRSSPDWRASVPVESPATIALVWVGLLAIGAALGAGSRAQGSPNRRRLLSDPPTRFIDEGQRQ